ncbi:ABC transporter (plasmid) [Cupriavidus sp. USMAHM13]|uniref:ABC transporter ATP-binding protein n=1 Tax=Cupriavidus sp. USMAHM13 TaxID=1389192 RepID=UPI0008A67684|nr:ABC transporter ATP-binding protein [Cupriavidus sp. USMAHM13]AOZ04316.1 ABC transporter [Cupriavidus sp. USMAHM13]
MSNDRSPLFRVRDVYKTYQAGEVVVHALNGVDLDLFDREFVALLGASGSGKSTLLHILGGLDRPTSGTIEYQDHDLAHADEAGLTLYRREHVGFVFQFYNLIPSLTALENVALVADIAEHPMNPLDALELVGLSARKDHFPAQLSGGEQQRIAIARAVVKQPDILLCDEPTGALDYSTGRLVLEVLQRVNTEQGAITAVITHNTAIAAMADRVLHISSGRITEIEQHATRANPSELRW